MELIIKAGYAEETIRTDYVELAGFHLRRAYRNAKWLADNPAPADLDDQLEHSILAVHWSILTLETAVNSIGADVVPESEYSDFVRCRKNFHKPAAISSLVWKWHWLFKLGAKKEIAPSDSIFLAVEQLVQLRHRLTHYSAQDAVRRIFFPPPTPEIGPDGSVEIRIWNDDTQPSRVEPSLVERAFLSDEKPRHYMAARQLIIEWHLANGGDATNVTNTFLAL